MTICIITHGTDAKFMSAVEVSVSKIQDELLLLQCLAKFSIFP